MTDDQVQQILKDIAATWLVDDHRIRWLNPGDGGAPGFDWWPGDFCVRVRAQRHIDPETDARIRIAVDTDLLGQVAFENEEFPGRVELMKGAWMTTCAPVYLPKPVFDMADDPTLDRKLWLSSVGYVSPQTAGWFPEFLAMATLMQPMSAQWLAQVAADMLGIGVPDANRPEVLRDEPLDEMLGALVDYAAMGQLPSRFAGTGEFEEFAKTWGEQDNCYGCAEPAELTVETPFGQETALIRLRTGEKHIQLGHGLLATMRLPYSGDHASAVNEAASLNLLESRSWTGFPFLGCCTSRS